MLGDIKTANYLREVELHKAAARRRAEKEAAERASKRVYQIDIESREALERGDRQRTTGCYESDGEPLDVVDAINRFENGEMNWDEVVALFQNLVDTGMAWQLQGSYGRHAQWLIDSGVIKMYDSQARGIARDQHEGN